MSKNKCQLNEHLSDFVADVVAYIAANNVKYNNIIKEQQQTINKLKIQLGA